MTWSDDGHQYTMWGDGGGFGGTNDNGRVSLGAGRVEGDWFNYTGYNVWGGVDPENPAQYSGKSRGIVSIGGVLYAWWGPQSGATVYSQTRLMMSTDKGATWTLSSWDLIDVDDQLVQPTILNFGRDYAGARDTYVYHYFIRREQTTSGLGIHRGGNPPTGKIDLARVPTDEMMNQSAYEFFAGVDGNGDPLWTSDASQREPAFEDPNGVGFSSSMSYNAGLGRYLFMTEHTESFQGLLGIFDAPEPWGPWTTVEYFESSYFGQGHIDDTTFFWNFSNKWLSADGIDFTLVFTGIGENDSWNTLRGSFDGGPPPTEFFWLNVQKSGTGTGTVSSSPSGIDCGSDCQELYPSLTGVTLFAVADAGSVFTGWGGDSDCSDGVVTMSRDLSCVASFETEGSGLYRLTVSTAGAGVGTVTSSPVGIDCGTDCQEDFSEGTSVELFASAGPGSVFAGWSGDAGCSDGTVTMSQDLFCTATFDSSPGSCPGSVRIDYWSTYPDTSYTLSVAEFDTPIYTDRTYTITALTSNLEGGTLIRTANDDSLNSVSEHLHLTLCADAMVYIGYDTRAFALPSWLNQPEWSMTGEVLISEDGGASPMAVYSRQAPAGSLILGGNREGGSNGASSNYVVIVSDQIFSDGFESGTVQDWQ